MKGLLIKDYALCKKQQKSILMVILMFIMFTIAGVLNTTFIMGYVPFIFCLYVMSSINYDEFDNGFPFLLTLPVTRKTYVREKYIFGISMSVIGSLLAGILGAVLEIRNVGIEGTKIWLPEGAFTMAVVILILGISLGIMIPTQLKFGSEKGRIVLFGITITIIGLCYLIGKYEEKLHVNFSGIIETLDHTEPGMALLLLFVITAAVLIVSYGISVKIMEKKSFNKMFFDPETVFYESINIQY